MTALFAGPMEGWGTVEYATSALIIITIIIALKWIFSKHKQVGLSCKHCGTSHGVSRCVYCQDPFCQTHMFREAHHCQERKRDAIS
jgi:hypothetical protein